MSRPDPIEYAERLYAAIRAANFSPISFLAFGNAVKDGVELRRMPRIAAEPFMRVVGEMLDLEEQASANDIIDANRMIRSSGEFSEPPASLAVEAPGSDGRSAVLSETSSTAARDAAASGALPSRTND